MPTEKTCANPTCGRTFTPSRPSRRYCSRECANRAARGDNGDSFRRNPFPARLTDEAMAVIEDLAKAEHVSKNEALHRLIAAGAQAMAQVKEPAAIKKGARKR